MKVAIKEIKSASDAEIASFIGENEVMRGKTRIQNGWFYLLIFFNFFVKKL